MKHIALAMVDLELGNLGSVRAAFERAGAAIEVIDSPDAVATTRALVLPGVGAFGDGMAALRAKGLVEPVRRHVAAGKPLLGICLGMQLLADEGEEHGRHAGLGIVPGRVVRLAPTLREARVPNMGWCAATFSGASPIFARVANGDAFYFAHSYHFVPTDPAIVTATINYGGQRIVAALQRGNVQGVQFHPEKSQDAGLLVVEAWARQALGGQAAEARA